MGLIFNYFRIGLDAPPSKIGPNQARKLLKTVLESSKKSWGVLHLLKMSKNAIYLAKNAFKNQTFFCFFFIWKIDNFTYKKCTVAIFKC